MEIPFHAKALWNVVSQYRWKSRKIVNNFFYLLKSAILKIERKKKKENAASRRTIFNSIIFIFTIISGFSFESSNSLIVSIRCSNLIFKNHIYMIIVTGRRKSSLKQVSLRLANLALDLCSTCSCPLKFFLWSDHQTL